MLAAPCATAALLLLTAVAKLYDAVVAMTHGGPGTASEVPAKFIMDHLFGRANIALASAGATVLVLSALAVLAPVLYARARAARVRAGVSSARAAGPPGTPIRPGGDCSPY